MASRSIYDFSGVRRVFSNRNFAIYAAGNSISLVGLWVQRLAVGWLAWDLTHSGFWLGAVAFADLFPVMAIGLFGGVLADRYDRRTILMAGQCLVLLQALVLFGLTAAGRIEIASLFALSLVQGIVVAVIQPARLSLVPGLVRDADLGGAVAISAVIFNIARFLGPAIAGVLITVSGVAAAFAFNAVSYLALIVALLWLDLPPTPVRAGRRQGVFAAVGGGLAYAVRHPAIAPVLVLMTLASLLARPAFELLPGFADAVFARGPGGLAVLTSSVGLGALSAGLWLAQRGSASGFAAIALAAGGGAGASVAVFAAASSLWIGAPALAAAGFCVAVLGICTQTLIQTGVADEMRGRVLSIWGMLLRGTPAVGALAMGALSELAGLQLPVLAGSLACVAAVALLVRRRGTIARVLEQRGGDS